jgi:hypothetical protein
VSDLFHKSQPSNNLFGAGIGISSFECLDIQKIYCQCPFVSIPKRTHVKLRAAAIGFFLLAFVPIEADDIKLESGNLSFLKAVPSVCVKYVYEGLVVGKTNEADFVKSQVADANKGGAGKADEWLGHWNNDRAGRYQPLFEERLNKVLNHRKIEFGSTKSDAKYTMILKTLVIVPGWAGWGLIHKTSEIDAVATFVETGRADDVLAVISLKHEAGNGFDYNVFGRIADAYGNCGKQLGHFLDKKAFK